MTRSAGSAAPEAEAIVGMKSSKLAKASPKIQLVEQRVALKGLLAARHGTAGKARGGRK